MTLKERYVATLIGVHIGDTRGAPYEKMFSAAQIAADITARGSRDLFDYRNPWPKDDNGLMLPAGRPTDDSDQTADLADSLVRSSGLDVADLRNSLRRSVIDGKSLLWSGQATGAGGTTKGALGTDEEKRTQAHVNPIGTNGSLMRCAPMALWFGSLISTQTDTRTQYEQVCAMSSVTHTHPHSQQACWLYTKILRRILGGLPWLGLSPENELEVRIFSRLRDKSDFPYDPGDWPQRGAAEFSLYVALYALNNTTAFVDGIELAVGIGGDTDTYAAIAGGLLGAKYGYDAIPENWRQTILGHDVMVNYAQNLYDMRLYR